MFTTESERVRRILGAREKGDSAGEKLSFNLRTGQIEGKGPKGLDGEPTVIKAATDTFALGGRARTAGRQSASQAVHAG